MKKNRSNLAKIFYILIVVAVLAIAGWFMVKPYLIRIKTPNISSNFNGKAQVSENVVIPITIDTKDATINAAEVYLKFNNQELKVISVSKENSFFKLWITDEPKFSNEKAEISFAGGLPTPGFKGKGVIGSVTVTPLKKGLLYIEYDSKTRVLLNDGVGTAVSLRLEPIKIKVQ